MFSSDYSAGWHYIHTKAILQFFSIAYTLFFGQMLKYICRMFDNFPAFGPQLRILDLLFQNCTHNGNI
jgi:hypothetical protein